MSNSAQTILQRRIFALMPGLGVTQESFACHLSDAWSPTSRSRVAMWATGERMPPVDVVVELARHAAAEQGKVPADIAERVLGPLLRALDCVVIRLPEAKAGSGLISGLAARALGLGSIVGDLQSSVGEALADGDLDSLECEALTARIEEAIADLSRLRAEIAAHDDPPRASLGVA